MSRNFAVTGVAGYIAPRHLKAIKETNNRLIAAVDPNDSVGVLDQFFQGVKFFTEFERFDRHLDKLRRLGHDQQVHYLSICSPNYLHDAHVRFALRIGADAICEKPLVLNPWNIDALRELEQESGKKINTILQLRVHPSLLELKKRIESEGSGKEHDVILTYITSRGPWYLVSWKGQPERSGGLATNIGIHFFDMLIWLFGDVIRNEVHINNELMTGGFLQLERAKVRWFLSIDRNQLPKSAIEDGKPTFRSITIDDHEVEFSGGFTDLHTISYKDILDGQGFGLDDAMPSINLAHDIRVADITENREHLHPLMNQ